MSIEVRRKADLINLITAIMLVALQTYQGSQARIIQERLNDIEYRQKVIQREIQE